MLQLRADIPALQRRSLRYECGHFLVIIHPACVKDGGKAEIIERWWVANGGMSQTLKEQEMVTYLYNYVPCTFTSGRDFDVGLNRTRKRHGHL